MTHTSATNKHSPDQTQQQHHTDHRRITCMEIVGGNRTLETSLSVPGIDVFVQSDPWQPEDDTSDHAQARGGDVTYISLCNAGRTARFLVADVSGHGQTVSHAAETLRKLVRKNINRVDQSKITRAINEAFATEADGLFATALTISYDLPSSHLVFSNAGHPKPLLYRNAQQRWKLLDEDADDAVEPQEKPKGIANLPLGIIAPTDYTQFAIPVNPGDLVLLYTDAVTEAPAQPGSDRQLGESGVLELIRSIPRTEPENLIPALHQHLAHRYSNKPIADDCTIILLHHHGNSGTPIPLSERVTALARMLGLSKA